MGKQVKGWTPPDEDTLVETTPQQQPSQWTPPESDTVEGPKKKESTFPSSSDSVEPGKPSKPSTAKSIYTGRKYKEGEITIANVFRDLVDAYNTPISAEEKAKEGPDFFLNAIKRGTKLAETAGIVGPFEEKPTIPKIKRVAQLQKETQSLESSDAFQQFSSAETFGDALLTFAKNPEKILVELSTESISSMIQHGASRIAAGAATGAAVGSVVPGAGTIAGAGAGTIVGMADTSLGLEFTGAFMESLQQAGVDTTDPIQLQKAFEDDAVISAARTHAFKKGIPIALFDLVSGGVAGKIVSKPAKSIAGKVGAGAVEFAVQAAFGAGGELAGEIISGEEIQPGAILGEAFGEIAMTPVEASIGALTFNKSATQVVDEQTQEVNATDQSALDRKAEIIQAKAEKTESALAAGNPDIQPITNAQETQVAPSAPTEVAAVREAEAQEEAPVQADQEVSAPADTRVTQDVTDTNIPQTQYIAEEETGTYDFSTPKQTQENAIQERAAEKIPLDEASRDRETMGKRDTERQTTTQESETQQEVRDESTRGQEELTFKKTERGSRETGGIKGVPPKNQFKLNQGFNFERVQVILDDAQAELYQQGAQAKRNVNTSTDPANQEAIAFNARVNELARENRHKTKEIVLDFRKEKESGTGLSNAADTNIPDSGVREPSTPSSIDISGSDTGTPDTAAASGDQLSEIAEEGQELASGSAAPPSIPPTTKPSTKSSALTPQERKTYTGIKNDPDISETIKQGISEEGKTYVPRSLTKVTSKEADAIIEAKGMDESIKMYLDDSSRLHPDVDVAVGAKLFDRLQSQDNTADAIRVFEKLAQRGTELGQAVNAFKLMRGKTMVGIVNRSIQNARRKYKEKNQRRSQNAKQSIDKINTDAVEQVLKSKRVRDKISSEVKKGNVKKAIDFLEGLKIDTKGKALDIVYGVSAATWNTVISAVQKSLQAGLTISQAINKAVNGVKDPSFKKTEALTYLDDQLKDYRVSLDPTRAIKAELASSGQKIDDIIRQHYSQVASTKSSLIEKLIKDGNVPADQAQAVADDLSVEFDRLTRVAKEKALKSLLPKESKKVTPRARKEVIDQLIEQSNLGALSEEQYADVITDKLGVPKLTEQQLKDVQSLTDKVQKAKGDTAKSKAGQDLMNYIENLKGWNWMEATQSIWYANILSGPTTWLVTNPFANLTNLVSELAIDISQNPKDAGFILSRVATGLTQGLIQAKDVLKTGYSPFKGADYKTEAKPLLERIRFKGGKINPLNWLKYVTRAIKAGDILFFHPLKEQRLAVLALQEARKNKRTSPNKIDTHNLKQQLLKEDYDGALQQAESEGFKGREQKIRAYEILEEQRPEYTTAEAQGFAARATFNIKPEGTLGQLAEVLNTARRNIPAINYIVPFVNTIMNVANEYMNYNPIFGFTRVIKGSYGWNSNAKTYRKLTNEERGRIAIKATIGALSMAALAAMDDPDDKDSLIEVTANGTGDTQKNFELEKTGWRPYSIRVGDTWIGYKNTPLALPLASIGFMKDGKRYRKDPNLVEQMQIMAMGTARFMMDMSTLSGLSDFFEIFSKENISDYGSSAEKLFKNLEKILKSVVIPNYFTQMSRLVQEFTESPIKRADDIGESVIRDVPILRDDLGNLYDSFGDPVVPKQIEKFIPLNTHRSPEDAALFDFLKDKNLFVGKPSPQNLKPNGTPMTEEEYNKWAVASAKEIKARLKREYRIYLRQKNKEVISDWFSRVKQEERKKSKIKIFGYF